MYVDNHTQREVYIKVRKFTMFIIVVYVLFVINLVADFPPGESVVDDIRPHHVL